MKRYFLASPALVALTILMAWAGPSHASRKGTFIGLIYAAADGRPETSGSFRLHVGRDSHYEGEVHVFGYRFKFKGRFSESGWGSSLLIRNRRNTSGGGSSIFGSPVDVDFPTIYGFLDLWIDAAGQSITGQLTYFRVPSLSWTSTVEGYRIAEDDTDIPENGIGTYTFLLNNPSDSPNVLGYGFGTATISRRRTVRLRGELPDGSKFTSQSEICRGGFWPVHGKMNRGQSALVGWMGFAVEEEGWLGGDLQWLGSMPGPITDNFSEPQQLAGVRYQPVLRGESIFAWPQGELILDSPIYPDSWVTPLTFDARQSWILGDGGIQFSRVRVQTRSGVFSASFRDPITGSLTQLRGAILPLAGVAGGYFRGKENAGWVWIQEHEESDQGIE